jgi:hypothetical protein
MARRGLSSGRSTPDAGDSALAAKLSNFLATEKALSGLIDWKPDGRNLRFAVALEIDGITEAGLLLFGRASLTLRDRNVTLGLSWDDPTGQGGNFDRLDWLPLAAHSNKGLGPLDHRFSLIEGTHHHSLRDNSALTMGIRRAIQENLPVATPIEPDPADGSAFLALAAQRWSLHELVHTPLPPWQYDLALPAGAGPTLRRGRKA